jgi:hypothetical protein
MKQQKLSPLWLFILFFLVVWASTFSIAYVNGDDVIHMADSVMSAIDRGAFVPELSTNWVPNRAFEVYSRWILTSVFDLLYFPLKISFDVDFFWFYKFFTATLFAFFLSFVLWYLLKRMTEVPFGGTLKMPYLAQSLVAVALLLYFPWKNQVHLIAYQMANVLLFILVYELFRSVYLTYLAITRNLVWTIGMSQVVMIGVLSYVVGFSVESCVLILLMVTFCGWIFVLSWKSGHVYQTLKEHRPRELLLFKQLSAWLVCVCGVSLSIAIFLSLRVKNSENISNVHESIPIWILTKGSSFISVFLGFMYYLLFIVFIGFFVYLLFVRKHAVNLKSLLVDKQDSFFVLLLTGILAISSVIVTLIISSRAHFNYFNHVFYPWGDFLLAGKIVLLYGLGFLWTRVNLSLTWGRVVGAVFSFVLLSRCLFVFFTELPDKVFISKEVGIAYQQLKQPIIPAVIKTPLKLNQIPLAVIPLPFENCPEWCLGSYRVMFYKYYDVKTPVIFE